MSFIDKASWQKVSALLDELLEASAGQRAGRLAQLKIENPELADEVAALLAHQPAVETDQFLEGTVFDPATVGTLAGQSVGGYTLERPLGQGGMGSVWLARRSDGRYEGQAAVKFLNLALLGRGGAERLRREASVLAKLAHPNITHLIDAGVTAGQPYLILEYVEGEPIDAWCDKRSLDVLARVRLFLQVLAAVAHAHGRLILHRDLKPSNILVTADGCAKLLDFGIAKLLEGEGQTAPPTELTGLSGAALTPDYAAPEQMLHAEVSTATDVYALGVLLYLLLTGTHPTASKPMTPIERMRALLDDEPVHVSDVAAKLDVARAGARHASPLQLARVLRGDLDNILAKALKKVSTERYATVEAFAEDLQRYLNHEPVSARADSGAYRLNKFVRRHRLAVTAASAIFLALAAGIVGTSWQSIEARRQRDRALALSARNAAVVDFMSGMLTQVAPNDQPIHVSELLERSEQLLLGTDTDPEHQAAILTLLAEYYLSGGNPTKARPLLDRSLQLTANSSDAALKAIVICNNAYAISLLNRRDEAIQLLEKGIEMSRVDPLAAVRCLQKRAFIAQNFNDAEGALKYSLEARASLGDAHVHKPDQEAALLADIAYAYYLSGRTAEADRYYQDALNRYTQLGRAEGPATFTIRNNWGIASFAAGDNQRALENYDEALRIAKRRDPNAEPPVYLLTNRALALASLARHPEAMQAFDVAIGVAVKTNNVAAHLHALVNRAGTYLLVGDVDRADRELAAVEKQFGSMIPPDSVPAVTIRYLKGRLAAAHGDLPQALSQLTTTIDFFDQRGMAVAPVTRALNARADAHLKNGDIVAARTDARRALEMSRKLQDEKPHSSLTGQSLLQLAEVESVAQAKDAARSAAREAFENLVATLGATHPDTIRAKVLAQ